MQSQKKLLQLAWSVGKGCCLGSAECYKLSISCPRSSSLFFLINRYVIIQTMIYLAAFQLIAALLLSQQ